MMRGRIDQLCDLCGQVDKHPRHSIASPSGVRSSHFDCCSQAGCEVCTEALAAAPEDSRHGDALIRHLTKDL